MDELLARVRDQAGKAGKEEDFASIFTMLREFRDSVGPLKYDNGAKWKAFGVIAALGAAWTLAYFLAPELQATLGDAGYYIMGGFGLALVVLLAVIGTANAAFDEISDIIFEKDIAFDNGLTEVEVEDGHEMYERLRERFGDFRSRGDESRYIRDLVKGEWTGTEHSFPFEYYVFHYVRVYYVTVTKKVGNQTVTTRERRTETLYRYGLLLDFPFAKGIAVTSGGGSYDYPEGFQPTSESFSGSFEVGADDRQTAARFLKPAVVLAFTEMNAHFSGLNVEIDREGKMNIAFSDSDVLDLERRSSIADPDAFEAEIRSHLALPKLRMLLQFVETLKKHNDSNF
ncbi:MAG TPA: hypothetical protein VL426_00695 [Candidatus Binatia bacterium]|nr:hypothetical protein [Candidatus Binatia bacterium]